jgi:hypothetical protein
MNASGASCNSSLHSLITLLLVHMQEQQMAAGGRDGQCLGHFCIYMIFFPQINKYKYQIMTRWALPRQLLYIHLFFQNKKSTKVCCSKFCAINLWQVGIMSEIK